MDELASNIQLDTKVMDSDGNPLVVYHGSIDSSLTALRSGDFFGSGFFGRGINFTSSYEDAAKYASIDVSVNLDLTGKCSVMANALGIPYTEAKDHLISKGPGKVYHATLLMKNPLVIGKEKLTVAERIIRQALIEIDFAGDADRFLRHFNRAADGEAQFQCVVQYRASRVYRQIATLLAKDGLIIEPSFAPMGKGATHYFVFDESQVHLDMSKLESPPLPVDQSGVYSINEPETSSLQSRQFGNSQVQKPAANAGWGNQFELFLPPEAEKRKAYADIFGTVITARPVTTVSSAINRIHSIADVAHVLASIRKDPQESFYAIATDANGTILRVMSYSRGTADGARVYPIDVVAEAASIEGAANLHLAHNHPGSTALASDADEKITKIIFSMLDGTGIAPGHHGIVAGTKWADGADRHGFDGDITPQSRSRFSIPITQRRIVKRGAIGEAMSTPNIAIKATANHNDALFLLNSVHEPVAILQMSTSEMEKLRAGGQVARILAAISKSNARGAVIKTDNEDAARNIARLLNSLNEILVLDWISKEGSNAQGGGDVRESSGPFFSVGVSAASAAQTETPAFKRWFGDSKVVDAVGKPLVVYHGTKGKFSEFKTPAWFTPNEKFADLFSADWGHSGERSESSNVIPVYLHMTNPVKTDNWGVTEPDEAMLKQYQVWKQEGHDGIIFTSAEGEVEYVVFEPGQIKSAIGNTGSFDRANHDIRHSFAGKSAPGVYLPLTPQSLTQAFELQFPKLVPAVSKMLERGKRGEKGGAVVISSADPLVIAKTFTDKTGRKFSDAVQMYSGGGVIRGCYDPKSGLTFLIGPHLDPVTGPGVLLHEMVHGQQRKRIDNAALAMIKDRANAEPELRAFLDRVAARMADANETANAEEAAAYIVEQAVTEGRTQGYAVADSRFLGWVDATLGKNIGDLLRSFIASVRQWMLRNDLPVGPIDVDDLVSYSMVGVERASRGKVVGDSFDGPTRKPSDGGAASYYDDPGAREIARGIKNQDPEAIELAATAMAARVNRGDVLVPAPSRSGRAVGTLELAKAIAEKSGAVVMDILSGKPRESMYDAKAGGRQLRVSEMRMQASGEISGKTVHIVDNVIGTGTTMQAALDAIPGATPLVYAQDRSDAAQKAKIMFGRAASTNTPAFKRWFSDSKVVDSEGKPLVVYHGTARDFNAFAKKGVKPNFTSPQKHLGFFFTDDPAYSDKYTSVYRHTQGIGIHKDFKEGANTVPVYLSIQNPKVEPIEKIGQIEDGMRQGEAKAYRSDLESRGYDGVIFEGDTPTGFIREYVTFNPEQIKSAIGNIGTFDPDNPDIRFSLSAKRESSAEVSASEVSAFKRWFGDSKVVDADGKPRVVYHNTNADFTVFREGTRGGLGGNGIYFSDYPLPQFGRNQMKVYLRIENPITPKTELPGMRELNSAGLPTKFIDDIFEKFPQFDGIMNRSEIVVKSSSQIRSATDNFSLSAEPETSARSSASGAPAFQRWFGDSKVVDSESKPLTVYHGTTKGSDFTSFRVPTFFTSSEEFAGRYAEDDGVVVPVHLRLNNPILIDALVHDLGADAEELANDPDWVSEQMSEGHDGLIIEDGDITTYVVFYPDNIRPVTENNLEMNSNDPDIHFSRPGDEAAEIQAWFSGSVVTGEDSIAPLVVYHGAKSSFTEFDMDAAQDGGHWFVADKEHAAHFGVVGAFCLSIKNPMVISQDDLEAAWDKEHANVEDDDSELLPRDFVEDFVTKAKVLGHDGLVIKDMADLNEAHDMYLAFSADQIKQADSAVKALTVHDEPRHAIKIDTTEFGELIDEADELGVLQSDLAGVDEQLKLHVFFRDVFEKMTDVMNGNNDVPVGQEASAMKAIEVLTDAIEGSYCLHESLTYAVELVDGWLSSHEFESAALWRKILPHAERALPLLARDAAGLGQHWEFPIGGSLELRDLDLSDIEELVERQPVSACLDRHDQ